MTFGSIDEMITINDNHEQLVDVSKYCPDFVVALDKERLIREKTAYLRKSVVEKLNQASTLLPQNMTFVIRDAWRPSYVQFHIIQGFRNRFRTANPDWTEERLLQEVRKYAAPATGPDASGHLSGGAIDLRLVYKSGRKVPMRSKKLTYQENAQTVQPKLALYLQKNRQIMIDALSKVGFVNYENEFWHWSYGDIGWARITGSKTVIYGIVEKV